MTQTKTKTVVGVGLLVGLVGTLGFAGGIYYLGQRAATQSAPSGGSSQSQSKSVAQKTVGVSNPPSLAICRANCQPAFFQDSGNKLCQSFSAVADVPDGWKKTEKCTSSGVNLVAKVVTAGGVKNNQTWNKSVTVTNEGGVASGPFKVDLWLSLNHHANIANYHKDIFLGTEQVNNLGPSESVTLNFANVTFKGAAVHSDGPLVAKLDPDNAVAETDENNDFTSRAVTVVR